MNRKLLVSLIVGIAISAGGLYLAFRNVPFADLVDYLGAINYLWLLPALAIGLLSFIFRVIRWQIILESSRRVSFWPAFHPLMIAFMINCVLPGRVGELARPAILKKKEGVQYSTGLATVAAERAFDILVIIAMFFMVLNVVQIDPDANINFGDYQLNRNTLEGIASGMTKLSLILVVGIISVSVDKSRGWINHLIINAPSLLFFAGKRSQDWIREKISLRMVGLVNNFASGFALVKSPAKLISCLVLSIVIWLLAVMSYTVFAMGCPGVSLTFFEMTAVLVIICLFIALPSVPGYWGLWEAGGIFAMTLFGVSSKEAAGFTLANHAIQTLPIIVIGAGSALITGVNIWQASTES